MAAAWLLACGLAACTPKPDGGSSSSGGASGTGGRASGAGGQLGAAGGAPGTGGAGGGQPAPVDQTTVGTKAAAPLLDNFDGLAVGNPSDLSIAVGPDHIVQVVNWSMAVYSKKGAMYPTTGMTVRGPVTSNT